MEFYQRIKAKKQADIEAARQAEEAKKAAALAPEAILAKANQFGVQSLTPEEQAAFQAYNQMQGAKVTIDPLTKETYSPFRPIQLGGASSVMFPQPEAAPAAPQAGGYELLAPPAMEGSSLTAEDYRRGEAAPSPMGRKDEKSLLDKGASSAIKGTKAFDMKIADTQLAVEEDAAKKENSVNLEKAGNVKGQAAQLPMLFKVVDELDTLADKASYNIPQKATDWVMKQVGVPTEGAVARSAYEAKVRNVVLPLLRTTFGAAFTAAEGQSLLETLGALDASPAEKKATLRAFVDQKVENLKASAQEAGVEVAVPQASTKKPVEIDKKDPRVMKAVKAGYSLQEIREFLNAR
jgi:hypothetical protein